MKVPRRGYSVSLPLPYARLEVCSYCHCYCFVETLDMHSSHPKPGPTSMLPIGLQQSNFPLQVNITHTFSCVTLKRALLRCSECSIQRDFCSPYDGWEMAVLTEVRPLEHQSGPWMRTFLPCCRTSSGMRGARRSNFLARVPHQTPLWAMARESDLFDDKQARKESILPYLSYLSFVMLRLDGPPNRGCHHLVSAFLSRIVSMNNPQPSLLAPPLQYIFVSPSYTFLYTLPLSTVYLQHLLPSPLDISQHLYHLLSHFSCVRLGLLSSERRPRSILPLLGCQRYCHLTDKVCFCHSAGPVHNHGMH